MKVSKKLVERFNKANDLLVAGNYEESYNEFVALSKYKEIEPLTLYKLATIANIAGEPLTAKNLFYKAFEQMPNLCAVLFVEEHPNKQYVFEGKKDMPPVDVCPLCGNEGVARWCYSVNEMVSTHTQYYNPVRLWVYCERCHHIYADEFPAPPVVQRIDETVDLKKNYNAMQTKTHLFGYYSEILTKMGQLTQGNELLEIGVGASECALSAMEMGFDVFGIDISIGNVLQARKYGIDADVYDFMLFDTDKKWDIVVMGDVIEHVCDPVAAIEKVYHLMNDGGALWLSTPNFDAAFSKYAGHDDSMRREVAHKNYFSRNSLFALLERFGFTPVDYRISSHYNGSMEVIAVKGVLA